MGLGGIHSRALWYVALIFVAWLTVVSLINKQLLICALGSLATDFGPPTRDEDGGSGETDDQEAKKCIAEAQQYFAAAQKRVGICLGKLGILEAQCFFYCGVYHVTMMQPEAAWTMFLQALASCQNFQCLTPTESEDNHSPEVEFEGNSLAVAEECTYWTCLKSEL